MDRRLQLRDKFREILGTKNVYFQPPASVRMTYPAIRYELSDIDEVHANNGSYLRMRSYMVTLIDPNPDSEYVDKILAIPGARFNRFYSADNLNHFVFEIYY